MYNWIVTVANDPRELDEFKKHNTEEKSWILVSFKQVIMELAVGGNLPFKDLYSITKIAFEFMQNDTELWTNLQHNIFDAVTRIASDVDGNREILSGSSYLIRSLILLATYNPSIPPPFRLALEHFLEDDFKNLTLPAKCDILVECHDKYGIYYVALIWLRTTRKLQPA